ncbi:MAG TPA: ABC transporter ATP-binding protein [Thermoplasmata archaeon]|nr:ABC transporter ATP-binding protein [Thermoplasmata archaeon]
MEQQESGPIRATETILRLEGLRVWFPIGRSWFRDEAHVGAVDGVTLDLNKGETVALVGESGCGKTTLGRAILLLIQPTAGRIVYEGRDVTHLREKDLGWLRRKAQMVQQDPYSSLNPAFTIFRSLEEPLAIHGIADSTSRVELVHKALEEVRLTPPEQFARKFPHMLSGGQRQRVAVARAMILNPELIVADEPVSMLDASVRISILNLLRDIQRKHGIAFVYITHDLATAKYFSERIAIMYAGKVAEVAPVESLMKEPLHPYTRALMDALPDPDPSNRFRERSAVPGEPPSLVEPPPGCRFHPRCPIAKAGWCDVEEPELRELRPNHFVACHLAA